MGVKDRLFPNVEKARILETSELENVIIDLLDGNSAWYEIRYYTGLSKDRCIEIEQLYNSLCNKT